MKKHLSYLSYVLRHRWFVMVECIRLGIPVRGLLHDLSKFLPSEWFAYADYFYGPDLSITSRDKGAALRTKFVRAKLRRWRFDLAWLHHQHRNPHHWQYWRLREDDGETKLIPMPAKYVKEMLADWRGAGKAQGFEKLGPWYEKNHRKIELAPETRDLLHSLMAPDELPPEPTTDSCTHGFAKRYCPWPVGECDFACPTDVRLMEVKRDPLFEPPEAPGTKLVYPKVRVRREEGPDGWEWVVVDTVREAG